MLSRPSTSPTDSNAPYFPPGSMVRRMHGEGVMLIGAGRALLMQVAHPAVAAGVEAHSMYKGARLARLMGTLRSFFAVTLGTEAQARAAAARVNGLHGHVRGAGYNALDPALLLWVHATIVDTGLVVYQRYVGKLSPTEREHYYQEMQAFGRLFGLQDEDFPASVEAFDAYIRQMNATIEVSPAGRTIATDLYRFDQALGPVLWPYRRVTAALLPPRLRDELGLGITGVEARGLQGIEALSRAVVPHLPSRLRRVPWFLLR